MVLHCLHHNSAVAKTERHDRTLAHMETVDVCPVVTYMNVVCAVIYLLRIDRFIIRGVITANNAVANITVPRISIMCYPFFFSFSYLPVRRRGAVPCVRVLFFLFLFVRYLSVRRLLVHVELVTEIHSMCHGYDEHNCEQDC